jgi:lauroyl/myristoyl acyltransferase
MTVAPRQAGEPPPSREARGPSRWTMHGLNNGFIFAATRAGVSQLPRRASYGIGHVSTWMAWRAMAQSRAAIADNLSAVFPAESRTALERRALETFRSYARNAIDFIRALSAYPDAALDLFDVVSSEHALFEQARAGGRGMILVTGHYGNWEVGSLLIRAVDVPLTVVAMTETDPTVNRIRREIRERVGVETIEVRQSLDTALQIRRRLADNHVVAMLMDRHYGRDRVAVTLFGRRAYFLRTPVVMAHATGAPLVPCAVERTAPGRFVIRTGPPIVVDRQRDRDDAIADAAQRVASFLESRIRVDPSAWYQFYRYWDAQRDDYTGLE